jgi:hypothetical protein
VLWAIVASKNQKPGVLSRRNTPNGSNEHIPCLVVDNFETSLYRQFGPKCERREEHGLRGVRCMRAAFIDGTDSTVFILVNL